MSVSLYRGQVDRLTSEIAQLEAKAAGERGRAAKERADGLRIAQSITKTTSASTAQSKLRDAQRREGRAVQHDRQAAQYATQSASKRPTLSDAQQRVERAETADRKKVNDAGDRRQREDERRLDGMERSRRALADRANSPGAFEGPSQSHDFADETTGGDLSVIGGEEHENDRAMGGAAMQLSAETTVDAALDVSKALALAALSSVPVVGPVFRELLGAVWVDNRAERLQRFANELGRNVVVLQDRLDQDFVKRDEFEALAEETLERVALRRNEQKLANFAAAVAHSATTQRPDQRARERFLDWVDQLRPIHLQLLARLAAGESDWVRPADVSSPGQVANSKLNHVLNGLPVNPLDLTDLQQRGLMRSLDDTTTLLNVANDVRAILTPVAREFLAFISAEAGAAAVQSRKEDATGVDDSRIAAVDESNGRLD